jgi:predicted ferric reductase
MAFVVHDARHLARRRRPFAGPEPVRAARRLWRVDLLQAAAVASVAVAVALFLADGGATRFGDLGAALTSLGIIAGLVATDLVLVMLLLAARSPLIERAVGHDAAMALHGRLGKPVIWLLVAHGLLLLAGYAVADHVDLMAEAVTIWRLPDLPLAILGFALFAFVVVSSLVAVRRKLRYEVWHLIHLLTYGAVLAALPHQFSVGGLFAEGTRHGRRVPGDRAHARDPPAPARRGVRRAPRRRRRLDHDAR